MQKKSKKILITTESHEITVILRNGKKVIHGYCMECAKQVNMLSLESAVRLTGKGAVEILSLFEQGEVHSFETTNGHLVVCENSLIQRIN